MVSSNRFEDPPTSPPKAIPIVGLFTSFLFLMLANSQDDSGVPSRLWTHFFAIEFILGMWQVLGNSQDNSICVEAWTFVSFIELVVGMESENPLKHFWQNTRELSWVMLWVFLSCGLTKLDTSLTKHQLLVITLWTMTFVSFFLSFFFGVVHHAVLSRIPRTFPGELRSAKVPIDEWQQMEVANQFDDSMAVTLYVAPHDDADTIDIDDFVPELAPDGLLFFGWIVFLVLFAILVGPEAKNLRTKLSEKIQEIMRPKAKNLRTKLSEKIQEIIRPKPDSIGGFPRAFCHHPLIVFPPTNDVTALFWVGIFFSQYWASKKTLQEFLPTFFNFCLLSWVFIDLFKKAVSWPNHREGPPVSGSSHSNAVDSDLQVDSEGFPVCRASNIDSLELDDITRKVGVFSVWLYCICKNPWRLVWTGVLALMALPKPSHSDSSDQVIVTNSQVFPVCEANEISFHQQADHLFWVLISVSIHKLSPTYLDFILSMALLLCAKWRIGVAHFSATVLVVTLYFSQHSLLSGTLAFAVECWN